MPHPAPIGSSSLRLMRRIRDAMAADSAAEARLGKVVGIIAEGMGVDVCSVYLLRAGDVLELFASVGLKQESVHKTRLAVGEGLVGTIAAHAQPLNLSDARVHPHFAYRPETGEEEYKSFLGVPILRSGKVSGVLVVQTREMREFLEEEAELLLTVAMVLAELVSGGELIKLSELETGLGTALFTRQLTGIRLSPGIAKGVAVLHEQHIEITQMVADDPEHEMRRLDVAIEGLRHSVDKIIEISGIRESDEHFAILESYRLFAQDHGWMRRIREAIGTGLTAEASVKRVHDEIRSRMNVMSDPYLRERLHDLEDLGNRLLKHLTGHAQNQQKLPLPKRCILVARTMGPAELLDYDRNRLEGLVLEEGSATSHIIIIARAMDIPVIGKVEKATDMIREGDPLILNADKGEIFIRPSDAIEQAINESIRARIAQKRRFTAMRELPSETKDGVKISLNVNAGMFVDIKEIHALGADGIGLYRTELPYMMTEQFPDLDYQTSLYRQVVEEAKGKPIIFRTFDIGGDKQLPYFHIPREDNPALGWRAMRIALDRPSILRRQLRAMLRACQGEELRVMFPMIADVAEFEAGKALLYLEIARARSQEETLPKRVLVGTMIEVPSILWQLDMLLQKVDFVSVGSNDLLQYLFAADRGNPLVGDRYDTLSPAMIAALRHIAESCQRAHVPFSFCGEMAGKPLEAMALIGLGYRSLSMPTPAIGPVKETVRALNCDDITALMRKLTTTFPHNFRSTLTAFARDHKIEV